MKSYGQIVRLQSSVSSVRLFFFLFFIFFPSFSFLLLWFRPKSFLPVSKRHSPGSWWPSLLRLNLFSPPLTTHVNPDLKPNLNPNPFLSWNSPKWGKWRDRTWRVRYMILHVFMMHRSFEASWLSNALDTSMKDTVLKSTASKSSCAHRDWRIYWHVLTLISYHHLIIYVCE